MKYKMKSGKSCDGGQGKSAKIPTMTNPSKKTKRTKFPG